MRILLTNDDGIDAPGLQVLEDMARTIGQDIWIVAPERDQSGRGRAVSLGVPVRTRQLDTRRFSVEGTPCDCILVAAQEIMANALPDLVLSGVNCGQNIAEDTVQSGTIGAALMAMQMGIPALAFSQVYGYDDAKSVRWETAREWGKRLLPDLVKQGWPVHTILNVNFPDQSADKVAGVKATLQGRRDELVITSEQRVDLRGRAYSWIGFRSVSAELVHNTDIEALHHDYVSVTPLHIDLTETKAYQDLTQYFERNAANMASVP